MVQRLRLPASTVEGEGSAYSIPDQGSSSCHMLRQKKKKSVNEIQLCCLLFFNSLILISL